MELESVAPESIEGGPPPPRRYSVSGGIKRRLMKPKSKERERKEYREKRKLTHSNSASDLLLLRPKRKSIKGTSLTKDEAKALTKKWRNSLSEPVKAELMTKRRGSRQGRRPSLPVEAMQMLFSTMTPSKGVQLSEEHKDEAYKIGFNVFTKTDGELVKHIDKMMDTFSLVAVVQERETMHNLIAGIRANYKSNPFHSFKHAFGVAHMAVIFILREMSIAKALGKRKILAFIIAGLGHDLNHPGNDNSFEIALNSQLVRDYTREAVLENYHAHNLLSLLNNPDNNVFQNLNAVKQKEMLEFIVEVVLGTDMKQHNAHVEFLEKTTDFQAAIRSRLYRRGLTSAIMHACDLSGQCVDLEVAVDWEARITEEFRNQAKLLKEKHKEVPQRLQDLENVRKRADLQLGFIDGVLEPLWAHIARCIPSMEGLYHNLMRVVRMYYKTLRDEGEAGALHFFEQYRSKRVFSQSGKLILDLPHRSGEGLNGDDESVTDEDEDDDDDSEEEIVQI